MVAAVAGLALVLAALTATAAAAGKFGVYVVNGDPHRVSVIDTASATFAGPDIPVEGAPNSIALAPDGSRAYVTTRRGLSSYVAVIDTAKGARATTDVPVEDPVTAVAITPDGRRVYVVTDGFPERNHPYHAALSAIDTSTNTPERLSIPFGIGQKAIAISPDGTRAYVTEARLDGARALVIDTGTNTLVGPGIQLPGDPIAIAVTPDGGRAYVADWSGNAVSVIDTTTNTLAAPAIPVGRNPYRIAISPDGRRAYVTNRSDGDVSVIDTATNTLVAPDIRVGKAPSGIAITPDGRRAYVTNASDNDLSVIDTASNTRARPDIPLGVFPGAIAIGPRPARRKLPRPIVGSRLNLELVDGHVRRKCGRERAFTRLTAPERMPVGCVIDASRGVVRLTSSRGSRGGLQSARLWGGVFRAGQRMGRRPFTTLTLTGRRSCGNRGPTRSFRKLWVASKGRFRSKGMRGAASGPRGTWLVADRCDRSTLVRVKRGVVRVRDFASRRTTLVRAGQRYLARHNAG